MRDKVLSYLGFATKAGQLVSGYNTCLYMINKKRIKLIIIATDVSDNTKDKAVNRCKKNKIEYVEFLTKSELSHITGNIDKGIYGITDSNFAHIIKKEIENNLSN